MEILVVIAILAVITTISVTSYRNSGGQANASGVIEELDVLLRHVQVQATSGREHDGDHSAGYGLYFNESSPNEYIYFADKDTSTNINNVSNDFLYDPTTNDEQIQKIVWQNDVSYIICAGADSASCDPAVDELNIVYLRPRLGPRINDATSLCQGGGDIDNCSDYSYAEITATSKRTGHQQTLIILSTGRTDIK